MTEDEIIEVVQAYKEGKQIQRKDQYVGQWININRPRWNFVGNEYRIAPTIPYDVNDFILMMLNDECIYHVNNNITPYKITHVGKKSLILEYWYNPYTRETTLVPYDIIHRDYVNEDHKPLKKPVV